MCVPTWDRSYQEPCARHTEGGLGVYLALTGMDRRMTDRFLADWTEPHQMFATFDHTVALDSLEPVRVEVRNEGYRFTWRPFGLYPLRRPPASSCGVWVGGWAGRGWAMISDRKSVWWDYRGSWGVLGKGHQLQLGRECRLVTQ
jgi:hypothetical protein